jgi:hypothetical protein
MLFDFFYRYLTMGGVYNLVCQFQIIYLNHDQPGRLCPPYPDVAGVFALVPEQEHMDGVLWLHA